jgi:hypothetical protein
MVDYLNYYQGKAYQCKIFLGHIPRCFPQYYVDPFCLKKPSISKGQHLVLKMLRNCLQLEVFETNYKHPKLSYFKSMVTMELDIYLPDVHLAFEYQGQMHFGKTSYMGSTLPQQERDRYASVENIHSILTIGGRKTLVKGRELHSYVFRGGGIRNIRHYLQQFIRIGLI